MYKKRRLEDLSVFKNNFFADLQKVMKMERCTYLSELLKKNFMEGNEAYFFDFRGNLLFRIKDHSEKKYYDFIDEKEKIQITVSYDQKSVFQSQLKRFMIKWNKKLASVEEVLYEEFKQWNFEHILDKPYLVYDIETTMGAGNQMDTYKFLLAYSMEVSIKTDPSTGEKKFSMQYEYIDQDGLGDFVQKLIDFDGYVIWYNSIAFDNPVSVLNLWYSQEESDKKIAIIDKKSIDLFLFIWNLTGRRIGLNKVSESFIGLSKTLWSWAEWEGLYQKYLDTWEEQYLEEFKKYCKNDVRMTLMVLLYLLHFKKIDMDEHEYTYSIEQFVQLSNKKQTTKEEKKSQDTTIQQSIF